MTTIQQGMEQGRDERRKRPDLDKRYGKIGISAVAGALKHQWIDRHSVLRRMMP